MQKHLKKLISLSLALLTAFTLVTYQDVSAETANAGEHFYVGGDSSGWSYDDNTITITESGDYTISKACDCDEAHSGYQIYVDENVTATITIKDVQITNSSDAAMYIDGTAKVTLVLEGDNSFVTSARGDEGDGRYYAGIEFDDADTEGGYLEITSYTNGTLYAQGGDYGAGIGGGYGYNGSNITISGGTVTAQGGYYGAGIGGGWYNPGNNITISGGNVTAIGGINAAGIGGGYGSNAENITISGGTVTATGGENSSGIGDGENGSGSDVTITGGTVKATGTNSTAISTTPQNGDGEDLYLVTIEVLEEVENVFVDGVDYNISSKHADDDNLYLYLTAGDHEIVINGDTYKVTYDEDSQSFNVDYLGEVVEVGETETSTTIIVDTSTK